MSDYAKTANDHMRKLLTEAEASGLVCQIVLNGKEVTWREWYHFLGYSADD